MAMLEKELSSISDVSVIDNSIPPEKYVAIDLSVRNGILKSKHPETADEVESLIQKYITGKNALVAYGGYLEHRDLYNKTDLFKNNETEKRDIHIGLDLWVKSGTTVLAALDGKIHSFNNNTGLGNYGPTIILKHQIQNDIFYTLYGHLSAESIENIEIGRVFTKGQQLATLGNASVNGDYAPHLHFQIINDIQDFFGDYPGVCSKSDVEFYMRNCPDPNLLLKINQ